MVHEHAVERHGNEAVTVRQCLDKNGPVQIWRSFNADTYYLICKVSDGLFGIQPVAKSGDERTAFIKGSWNDTIQYLAKFGYKFTGKLPWLH